MTAAKQTADIAETVPTHATASVRAPCPVTAAPPCSVGRATSSSAAIPRDGWSALSTSDRSWESAYRRRWQHDKVVRSTHGVNCTGSCSWKVHVKDGIITWETQQTDYPSNGPEVPEYEPRGCPRGATFSWYTYSPLRVKYPYVRGALLKLWREALELHKDPVLAWAQIAGDPAYKAQRGKGGFVRASWHEVADLVAAAHVHTIKRYGPDRIAGFSPIPAMSMASYAGGTRFLSLIGGVCLSFYDWYADLPPASPQIWGDQTDVPESGDWFNSTYLIMWGSNIPMTRTPDAHFMTEARYRGQKTVVVSPDYSDHTKFADHWLPAHPGSDGALAMGMGHVILKEFYVDRQVPYFQAYARKFTDMPFLVTLHRARRRPRRRALPARVGPRRGTSDGEHADWRTVVMDSATGAPAVPNGSIGDRWGEEGKGRWNLELGDIEPELSLLGTHDELVDAAPAALRHRRRPRRGACCAACPPSASATCSSRRSSTSSARTTASSATPTCRATGRRTSTTPRPTRRPGRRRSPASTPTCARRIAREFARNAERTNGRSMIVMGAGTNHWFHSDLIYRSMLNLVLLCGCQGVNGGGWAHYVGQEKVRTITGFSTIAFALDWNRPPRQQAATPFWYLATDQWRYDAMAGDDHSSPVGDGALGKRHVADCNALAARLGWTPSYPTFDRNPLDLADAAKREGATVADYVVDELQGRAAALRLRGPRRAGQLPARADDLALEPARLVEQGPRVLPQAPARDPDEHGDGARRRRPSTARRRCAGATRRPRASSTCSSRSTSAWPARRCTPTSCCRPPPGTRSTTSRRRTCTRSCTPSTRRSRRRGRPRPTGTSSTASRARSRAWPRSTSARARTSSRRRCCTTAPTSSPSRSARCATGARASASRSPAARCPSSSPSSATTASSTTRCARSDRSSRSSARPGRASRSTPSRRCGSSARATACRASA